MSLAVNVDRVFSVLLGDGKWHAVDFDDQGVSSFDLDSYEYIRPYPHDRTKDSVLLSGGQAPLVPATGATWKIKGRSEIVTCPITSILAVMVLPE